MREMTAKGKPIRLTEKDWHILERRFNPKSIEADVYQGGRVAKPCICDAYPACQGCPFRTIADDYGCLDALRSVLGKPSVLGLFRSEIRWSSYNDEAAREQVEEVHQFLLDMRRIK